MPETESAPEVFSSDLPAETNALRDAMDQILDLRDGGYAINNIAALVHDALIERGMVVQPLTEELLKRLARSKG